MKRKLIGLAAGLSALGAGFGIWQFQMGDAQADRGDTPKYAVDPSWPRALPHKWQIGQVPGIAVDKDDNIWIVQRPRTLTNDERGASDFNVPVGPGRHQRLDGPPRPQGAHRGLLPAGTLGDAVRSERPPASRVGRSGGSGIR